MSRKEGVVGRESAFFEFFLREVSTTPPPGSPHIPQRWRHQPQRARTAYTSQAAAQTHARHDTHARTLDTLHRSALDTRQTAPGRSYRRQGRPCRDDRTRCGALDCLRNVSDRARPNGQNYCKQKYLFFMCKPLDKRNKIVYNIDSKQTYLHHHKTGGQKP